MKTDTVQVSDRTFNGEALVDDKGRRMPNGAGLLEGGRKVLRPARHDAFFKKLVDVEGRDSRRQAAINRFNTDGVLFLV